MTVIRVDLRKNAVQDGHGPERDADGIVGYAVTRAQACDKPRFLIVDHASDLVEHRLLYEELLAYGSVPTVCLALGAPEANVPAANDQAEQGGSPGSRGGPSPSVPSSLARPLSLKPPSAGVLWAPDPEHGTLSDGLPAGEADPQRQWRTVRPLCELLEEPRVFDAVLEALGEIRDGVAVAAPHVLEHDLTPSARARVWRQAIEGLCGREVHVALPPSGTGEDRVPHELAPLVGEEVPKALGDRVWCMPRGEADERRRDCEAALREAQNLCRQVRAPFAWLHKETSRRAGLPDRVAELADALAAYRKTAEECLREGDGVRLSPEQRSGLARRGIDLPDIPEASREHVGPGLRDYTEKLIDRPLPLRSVAARLGALSDRSAPAGSAARLGRLMEVCPQEYVDELRRPAPFEVAAREFWPNVLPGFVTAFLAGLWPGAGWAALAGVLAVLTVAGLALLMQVRRPNCTADARTDGGGQSNAAVHLVTGLIGAVAGVAVGQKLMLPVWAGAAALCLAAAVVVVHATWQWGHSVDAWWERMRPEAAGPMWTEIETVLSEAAVHDWMLAEARLHCANGARAVSVLLRNFATEIEKHGLDSPAPARSSQDDDLFAEPFPEPSAGAAAGRDGSAGAYTESVEGEGTNGDWEPWDWDSWADDPEPVQAPAMAAKDAENPPVPAQRDDGDHAGHRAGDDAEDRAGDGTGDHTVDDAPASAGRHPADPLPEEPPRPLELRWLARESGDAGRVLVDTLVRDLADGVVRVLAGCWGVLETAPNAVGRFRVEGRAVELLDEERACLARDGAAAPPPYARPREEETRPGTAELFGIASDRVSRVLAEGEARAPQPLCSPSRTRMLSKDPGAARLVRFAPEAARRGASGDPLGEAGWNTAGDDVVWTTTGRFAGVLRLVPLRGGAVRTVRSYGEAHTEAAPGNTELRGPSA